MQKKIFKGRGFIKGLKENPMMSDAHVKSACHVAIEEIVLLFSHTRKPKNLIAIWKTQV